MLAADSSEEAERPAECENCISSLASSVMVLCKNYGPDHQVGCHSFCFPGQNVKGKRQEEWLCLACTDYQRKAADAIQELRDDRAGGRARVEVLPDLQRIRPAARVRHAAEVKLHPTEQQRIDHAAAEAARAAAAAAAAGHDDDDGWESWEEEGSHRKRQKTGHHTTARGAAAAAAAGVKSGGRKAGAVRQQKQGSGAAAAAAGASGGAAPRERRRLGPQEKFTEGLNKGKRGDVRAAQERVKAEKARREQRKRQLQEDDAAAHAGYDSDGGMEWQDEEGGADADDTEMQHADDPAAVHGDPAQRAGGLLARQPGLQMDIVDWPDQFMQAKLHCRLVVLPNADGERQSQQQPQDTNDVDNYLHVTGAFWGSEEIAAQAGAEQQEAHKQLLEDMTTERRQTGHLTLMGGAFDLASHPAVQQFMSDTNLSYKPLLFIPSSKPERSMVKDLLSIKRRFLVLSIESKLLVLLPNQHGELVAICPKELAYGDELTSEVVRTIMGHPKLGCHSQEAEGGGAPEQSESALGPPDVPAEEEQEQKAAILRQHPPPAAAAAAADHEEDQQQQQQPSGNGAQHTPPRQEHSPVYDPPSPVAPEMSGVAGQQQQQQNGHLPVMHLPAGMRAGQGQVTAAAAAAAAAPVSSGASPVASPAVAASGAVGARLSRAIDCRAVNAVGQQGVGDAAAAAAAAGAAAAVSHVAAAAAAAAAVSGGAAAASGGRAASSASGAAAVEGSGLAQLLRQVGLAVGAPTADQLQQRQQRQRHGLTLRSIMPQLTDLADVQHWRLFLVGFPQEMLDEGGRLFRAIQRVQGMVDELHYGPTAVDKLLQSLQLQPGHLPCSPHSTQLGNSQPYLSVPCSPQMGTASEAAAAGVAVALGAAASGDEVDLTEGPKDSCYRILLVPQGFDSSELQQQLGQVPLWKLLASPVAVFEQEPSRGILHELYRIWRERSAATGSTVVSGDGLQLPQGVLLDSQRYRDAMAVVVDASVLKHSSVEDLQQLLKLLKQAQELLHVQQRAAGGLLLNQQLQLVLSRRDMEECGAEKQEVLEAGLQDETVLPFEDSHMGSASTASNAATYDDHLVTAAAQLAALQQRTLRHVLIAAPDLQEDANRHPQSPTTSATISTGADRGRSPAPAGAGVSSRSKGGSKGGAAARASGGTAGVGEQRHAHSSDVLLMKLLTRQRLQDGAQQQRLLTGTLSQVLQFLACLVGNSTARA